MGPHSFRLQRSSNKMPNIGYSHRIQDICIGANDVRDFSTYMGYESNSLSRESLVEKLRAATDMQDRALKRSF